VNVISVLQIRRVELERANHVFQVERREAKVAARIFAQKLLQDFLACFSAKSSL